MGIHQIQIRHDEAEDRLLMRVTTTDHCEFRFWLTRRYTIRLWRLLVQMLQWDKAVTQQVDPDTRHAVLDLQHEGYAQQADYATKFEDETPRQMPLGEAPLLLATAHASKREGGAHLLRLQPVSGQGIDITADTRLLHVFMRLLREQVAKTEWEVNLELHDPSQQAAVETQAPRTIN